MRVLGTMHACIGAQSPWGVQTTCTSHSHASTHTGTRHAHSSHDPSTRTSCHVQAGRLRITLWRDWHCTLCVHHPRSRLVWIGHVHLGLAHTAPSASRPCARSSRLVRLQASLQRTGQALPPWAVPHATLVDAPPLSVEEIFHPRFSCQESFSPLSSPNLPLSANLTILKFYKLPFPFPSSLHLHFFHSKV